MAVRGNKYIVAKIDDECCGFEIDHEDKCILIRGFKNAEQFKKSKSGGWFSPERTTIDIIEQGRKDMKHYELFDEAVDEDGQRYLILVDSTPCGYHNDSFLLGLEDAIEQIVDEYDCCKLQFEGQEEKLKTIKMAFSRAISLIEDRMIQHNSKIKKNQFVDEFNRI
jgi:hypothetical protein